MHIFFGTGVRAVADASVGTYFINSEQVGDYVTVTMPVPEGSGEAAEQIRVHYLELSLIHI